MAKLSDLELPCKVKAVYSWGGEQDDDLGFIEGDIIEVDSFGDGSWWHGKSKRNKMTGNFPSNFVRVLDESPSANSFSKTITPDTSVLSSRTALGSKSARPSKRAQRVDADKTIDSIQDVTIGNSTFNADASFVSMADLSLRDVSFIDTSMRDNSMREASLRDTSIRDSTNREASFRDSKPKETNGNFSLSPEEIERQIQQLRQLQQLQQLQKKSQIAHSLSTPQNVNLLVNQLNDFYTHKSQEAAAARSAQTSSVLNKSDILSDLGFNSPLPKITHSASMPFNISSREFSNTSTLHPSSPTDILSGDESDSHSDVSDLPPPPTPPAHTVAYKPDFLPQESATLSPHDDAHKLLQRSNNTSFILPYDPDSLNQSKSSIHDYQNGISPTINSDETSSNGNFNSNDSVTSTVSTALTDFSATSAGSYYRHKAHTFQVNNGAIMTLPPLPSEIREQRERQAERLRETEKIEQHQAPEVDDNVDAQLKSSFMNSRYYRRVSVDEKYEFENSKGDVSVLNDGGPDPKEVIAAADAINDLSEHAHNPLDVVFVEEKKKKGTTHKFFKKLFLKEAGQTKSNPLNSAAGLDTPKPTSAMAILNTPINGPPTLKNQNFSELSIEHADSEASWIENKVDLNRSATISNKDYKLRQKRALYHEKWLILEPQRLVTEANSNEVLPIAKYGPPEEVVDFEKSFKTIDDFIKGLKHLPYISPKTFISNEIAIKYSSTLDRLRACFIFCTEKVNLVESNEIIDIRNTPSNHMNIVFQQKSATVYQLAYLMKVFLDELKIPNELIIGYFKRPNDENVNLTTNHVWNSVLINNEWRFIDSALANSNGYFNSVLKNNINKSSSGSRTSTMASSSLTQSSYSSEISEPSDSSIYFLTKPLELIHTHIPTLIEQQHISPPLDSMIALSLPSCYPQFFKTNLKIKKFNNALTRLQDLEVFEIVLEVSKDTEVYCAITPNDPNFDSKADKQNKYRHLCISQVFWKNNQRFYRIKATLPENCSKGFLEIYSGAKGVQKSLANVHPLSLSIALHHRLTDDFKQGESVPQQLNGAVAPKLQTMNNKLSTYRELQFVTRYPTVHCQKHDLYVKEPQIKMLNPDFTYIFKILQHPSMGLSNSSGFLKTKLALQSPTGRIVKLRKKETGEANRAHGCWEASVNCDEVGVWKGLVVTDGGVAWCVFAEWMCK